MLAADRINKFLVVFGYETGGFMAPCYPYFFDAPGFPDAAKRIQSGGVTTLRTPAAVSRWFDAAADDVLSEVRLAQQGIGAQRGNEFDSTVADLGILANLARFHARRGPPLCPSQGIAGRVPVGTASRLPSDLLWISAVTATSRSSEASTLKVPRNDSVSDSRSPNREASVT
jgi:hypothetical protein